MTCASTIAGIATWYRGMVAMKEKERERTGREVGEALSFLSGKRGGKKSEARYKPMAREGERERKKTFFFLLFVFFLFSSHLFLLSQ